MPVPGLPEPRSPVGAALSMPARLTCELVPASSWGHNLRSVTSAGWDRLRRVCYGRAQGHCECCGRRHRLEAHERWEYDEARGLQTLTALVALCPNCHEVKHFGRALQLGRARDAARWLMQVNGWTPDETTAHIRQAFVDWERRSQLQWTLDLQQVGLGRVGPTRPPMTSARTT